MKDQIISQYENLIFQALLLFLFLGMGLSLRAQAFTDDIHNALRDDNAEQLAVAIDDNPIDHCYSIEAYSYNLLSISIKYGLDNCFNYLMSKDPNVDADCSGKSILMYAAKYKEVDMLKALVKAGADPSISYKRKTALDYARKYGCEECVLILEKMSGN